MSETARYAAARIEAGADRAASAAGSLEESARKLEQMHIDEAVQKLVHLFEPGYGGNGLRLLEFLEIGHAGFNALPE